MGYRAFFSYARADDRIANWLHRQLDGYRTPKALVGAGGALGPVPPKLHPIFRDRTDLQAGGHIDASLQQALEESETLIVLCTPASAKSHWVNHECETFLRLGREGHIFPVIAAGEPDSGDPETECFPPSLRGKGVFAADLREIRLPSGQLVGDGKEGARLKLIAGLLGLPLDKLVQRERRRQRQTMAVLSAAALVFAGVALLAGMQTLAANRQRAEALNTLHRFYATRARERTDENKLAEAARYALAGMQVAPANAEEYRAALASAMHAAGETVALLPHDDEAVEFLYSPPGDHLVTRAEAGGLVLWNLTSRTSSPLPQSQSSAQYWFSWDGRFVFDANEHLWSTADGTLQDQSSSTVFAAIAAPLRQADGDICGPNAVIGDTSRDGRRKLCFSEYDGEVFIIDVSSRRKIASQEFSLLLDGDRVPENINFSRLSPDERFVISGSPGVVRLQDPRTLVVIGEISGGAAVFSPDGKWLAVARHNEIDIYDARMLAAREEPTRVNTLRGSPAYVRALAFSSNSTRLATAGADGAVRIWTDIAGRQRGMTREGSEFGSIMRDYGWDDLSLDDGRADASLVRAAERSGCPRQFGDTQPSAMRFLFTGDARLCVLDVQTQRVITTIGVANNPRIVAALSPNGETLVAQPIGGSLQWMTLPNRETIATLGEDLDTTPSVSFSPDGSRIVVITNSTVQVWRDNASRPIWTSPFQTESLRRALFTPDGGRLVLGQSNGAVLVYDAQTFHRIISFPGRWYATPRFSRDGTRMFIGSEVWDTTTGARLADLRGAVSANEYNLLSPDQNSLATMNRTDRFTGYLWDVSRLTQTWGELARDACNLLLGPAGRKFRAGEVAADPLLEESWDPNRDVCEGVEGVPSIEAVRLAASLPAVAPREPFEPEE